MQLSRQTNENNKRLSLKSCILYHYFISISFIKKLLGIIIYAQPTLQPSTHLATHSSLALKFIVLLKPPFSCFLAISMLPHPMAPPLSSLHDLSAVFSMFFCLFFWLPPCNLLCYLLCWTSECWTVSRLSLEPSFVPVLFTQLVLFNPMALNNIYRQIVIF